MGGYFSVSWGLIGVFFIINISFMWIVVVLGFGFKEYVCASAFYSCVFFGVGIVFDI